MKTTETGLLDDHKRIRPIELSEAHQTLLNHLAPQQEIAVAWQATGNRP